MDAKKVLEYSERTAEAREPEQFMGMGEMIEPGCKDVLRIYISAQREIITECSFTVTSDACPPLKACAARMAEAARGKTVMEAYLIRAAQLSEFFGGLSRESLHCAQMAEIAMKLALRDYAANRAGN